MLKKLKDLQILNEQEKKYQTSCKAVLGLPVQCSVHSKIILVCVLEKSTLQAQEPFAFLVANSLEILVVF